MSHAFPIAATLEDALKPDVPAARTRSEAETMAGARPVAGLVTDWLTLDPARLDALLSTPFAAARGHLQRYEDEAGRPVVALTWWKLAPAQKETKRKMPKAADKPAAPAADPPPAEDHTDDLYFRSGRTKSRRKTEKDPNQLNLFDAPDTPE